MIMVPPGRVGDSVCATILSIGTHEGALQCQWLALWRHGPEISPGRGVLAVLEQCGSSPLSRVPLFLSRNVCV